MAAEFIIFAENQEFGYEYSSYQSVNDIIVFCMYFVSDKSVAVETFPVDHWLM